MWISMARRFSLKLKNLTIISQKPYSFKPFISSLISLQIQVMIHFWDLQKIGIPSWIVLPLGLRLMPWKFPLLRVLLVMRPRWTVSSLRMTKMT
ncbi:hypothetical protein SCA6_010976 [Theobroma cacao]